MFEGEYKNLMVRSRGDGWEVVDLGAGAITRFGACSEARGHAEAIARSHGGTIYVYDVAGRLESSSMFPPGV